MSEPARQIILNRHSGIFGITQSGKTTWAISNFYANTGHAVFVNWQHIQFQQGVRTKKLSEIPHLLNVHRKVIYDVEDESEMYTFFDYFLSLGRRTGTCKITLYLDECDMYIDAGVIDAITKGMRYGIVVVIITQRPQMLFQGRTAIENLYNFIIFHHSDAFFDSLSKSYYISPSAEDIQYLMEECDKPCSERKKIRALHYNMLKWERL